jgi:hypothetical protein
MNELSTQSKSHVIIFTDKSKKFISQLSYDDIMSQSAGDSGGIDIGGNYIRFQSIAKILTIDEFYKQYPEEKVFEVPQQTNKPFAKRVEQLWIKKIVDEGEWKSFYSRLTTYCRLGNEGGGVAMGFCAPNVIDEYGNESGLPENCYLMNDEELRRTDSYFKGNNIFPQPMETIKI